MNRLKSSPPSEVVACSSVGKPVSPGRRRFTKGVAPVLLGTLASKPVLGAEYICTVSGQASGNASAHQTTGVNCDVGDTPEAWRDASATSWPGVIVKGVLPAVITSSAVEVSSDPEKLKGKDKPKPPKGGGPQVPPPSSAETPTTTDACTFTESKGTPFNGYAGLASTFYYSATTCALGVSSIGSESAASMYQILNATSWDGDAELLQLGRAVVASLLNASAYPNYPVNQTRVVEMFNAVKDGGSYFVEGAKLSLTRTGVLGYLQKLYTA